MTVEAQAARRPIPVGASKSRIHKFAEDAAQRLGYGSGGPIHELVSKLGGCIEHSDPFGEAPDESILVRDRGDFTVWISSFTSPVRDRFTIAHELAHYFLHFPKVREVDPNATMSATRWVDQSDNEQKRAEWEANWFAAGFLMPEEEYRKIYSTGGVEAAAAHFGVSQAAANVRRMSLGLD